MPCNHSNVSVFPVTFHLFSRFMFIYDFFLAQIENMSLENWLGFRINSMKRFINFAFFGSLVVWEKHAFNDMSDIWLQIMTNDDQSVYEPWTMRCEFSATSVCWRLKKVNSYIEEMSIWTEKKKSASLIIIQKQFFINEIDKMKRHFYYTLLSFWVLHWKIDSFFTSVWNLKKWTEHNPRGISFKKIFQYSNNVLNAIFL